MRTGKQGKREILRDISKILVLLNVLILEALVVQVLWRFLEESKEAIGGPD
jgi:hypothetical protein